MKIRMFLCLIALLSLFAASCGSDDAADIESGADADAEAVTDDSVAEDASAEDDDAMADEDHSGEDDDDAMADDATEDEATEDEAAEEEAADDPVAEDDPADDAASAGAEGDEIPQRIISLNPTATEMLFAIGAGDQVVAVDEFSYFPEEAPVTDLSGYDPNFEAIAGYEPDLVITESPLDGLAAVDIPNHVVAAVTTLDEIYAQIEQLGAMTGHLPEATELVLQMQTDIDAVLAEVPEREVPLTYFHELDNTLYSVTSTTFIGYVYSLFGLENIADPADADGAAFGYPQLNEEFIISADPDVIFLADTRCCAQDVDTVAARPGWDQIAAVQNGNVVELNDDIVSRWGPRIVEYIEIVGAAVNDLEPAATG